MQSKAAAGELASEYERMLMDLSRSDVDAKELTRAMDEAVAELRRLPASSRFGHTYAEGTLWRVAAQLVAENRPGLALEALARIRQVPHTFRPPSFYVNAILMGPWAGRHQSAAMRLARQWLATQPRDGWTAALEMTYATLLFDGGVVEGAGGRLEGYLRLRDLFENHYQELADITSRLDAERARWGSPYRARRPREAGLLKLLAQMAATLGRTDEARHWLSLLEQRFPDYPRSDLRHVRHMIRQVAHPAPPETVETYLYRLAAGRVARLLESHRTGLTLDAWLRQCTTSEPSLGETRQAGVKESPCVRAPADPNDCSPMLERFVLGEAELASLMDADGDGWINKHDLKLLQSWTDEQR